MDPTGGVEGVGGGGCCLDPAGPGFFCLNNTVKPAGKRATRCWRFPVKDVSIRIRDGICGCSQAPRPHTGGGKGSRLRSKKVFLRASCSQYFGWNNAAQLHPPPEDLAGCLTGPGGAQKLAKKSPHWNYGLGNWIGLDWIGISQPMNLR